MLKHTSVMPVATGFILFSLLARRFNAPLPITLTGAMPDLPDAATGLAHLAHGRYYNPALGRPLQPNTAVAPPTIPQVINRYTAVGMGQRRMRDIDFRIKNF